MFGSATDFFSSLIQALNQLILLAFPSLTTSITGLVDLIETAPFGLTVGNPIVIQEWRTMTMVANLFLAMKMEITP